MRTRSIRPAAVLAALGLAGSVLAFAAPPAQSAPVFVDLETTFSYGESNVHDHVCPDVPVATPYTTVPLVENGATASGTANASVTSTNGGGDDMSGTSILGGTSSVSSAGGNLKTMSLTAQGSLSIDAALPLSACEIHLDTDVTTDYQFVVTNPGFLTVNVKSKGAMYTEMYLEMLSPTNSPYYQEYGDGLSIERTTRVFLPAGTYDGYLLASLDKSSSTDLVASGNATVTASFAVAGSQTAAVSGKGKKYITLPAARSCATDSVNSTITNKKKRANQVKQVRVFVNDKLVKKVKTPGKGDAVNAAVADDVAADVRAEVKLFPKKKGKPGKVVEVTASYEACS